VILILLIFFPPKQNRLAIFKIQSSHIPAVAKTNYMYLQRPLRRIISKTTPSGFSSTFCSACRYTDRTQAEGGMRDRADGCRRTRVERARWRGQG
jgi:hypothetical protein